MNPQDRKHQSFAPLSPMQIAAYAHVESQIRCADSDNLGAPLWHGWALREAFIAGAQWQRRQAHKGAEQKR